MKKKFLTFLLVTLMVLSTVTVSPITASARSGEHIHDNLTFTAWGSGEGESTSLPTTSGSYYLTSDITLSESWSVPYGSETVAVTNLCLCGHVIKLSDGVDSGVISVPNNAELNLYDCDTTTEHYFKDGENGLWVLDDTLTGSAIQHTVKGGVITGGNTSSGGGVSVIGVFNMHGGNIVGNNAINGGGVYNIGSTFTMAGGSIVGNTATSGGGVFVTFTGVNVLTGGSVTANTADVGAGLYSKAELCFAAGTLITMGDGSQKPIETLEIGDLVRVFDHDAGEVSTAKLFDVWAYPEKHSGVVTLHFSHDIDVTVVCGHSFFEREQNRYVAVTKDNVSTFVGHEFYNVDDARWETLLGYDFIDGEVDTYVITSEKYLNCVANGMLSNEDGFYSLITNIFEFGDGLKIDEEKKASDIEKYGLWSFDNAKYVSKETYDTLNLKYLSVAFGKGMITPEAFNYLESYWTAVDPELYCDTDEQVENNPVMVETSHKALLSETPVSTPDAPGVYVGGSVKITGNASDNLYLASGKTLTIGTGESVNGVAAPTAEMCIGLTMEDGNGQFAVNGTAEDVKYFFSDANAYVVFNDNGTTDGSDDYLELAVAYSVKNDSESEYGYISIDTSAPAGATVTVTVNPAKGYALKADSLKVTYNDGEETKTCVLTPDANDSMKFTFTMPAYEVTVTAEFEDVSSNLTWLWILLACVAVVAIAAAVYFVSRKKKN